MTLQRTFSIIKPDAIRRNITGKVNAMIEGAGLRIVAQKRIRITKEQAERFYAEHKGKPFFEGLVAFMISTPVVVQVLEGEDAVAHYRKVMGTTDPAKAAEGTIRHSFVFEGQEIRENTVHGSDSPEHAENEIYQFFSEKEILP